MKLYLSKVISILALSFQLGLFCIRKLGKVTKIGMTDFRLFRISQSD